MTLDGVRDVVPVGIGDVHVSDQPGDVLVAYGLGSCVGVVVHDPVMKAGGMAHVALLSRFQPERVERSRTSGMRILGFPCSSMEY